MSKGSVEYAVFVDWPQGSFLIGPVVDEIGRARLHRDTIRAREELQAKAAGVEPAPVRLVMRTVSPWCEVYEQKDEDKK